MKTDKCSIPKQSFQPSEVGNKSMITSGTSLLRSLLASDCSQPCAPINDSSANNSETAELIEKIQLSEEHDEYDIEILKSSQHETDITGAELIYMDAEEKEEEVVVQDNMTECSEAEYTCEVLEDDLFSDDSQYHNVGDADESPVTSVSAAADPLCPTCLSSGRQMSLLGGEAEQAYTMLLAGYYEEEELSTMASEVAVCWECQARLADVIKLRTTILRAHELLHLYPHAAHTEELMSLSKLSSTTRCGFDYKVIYNSAPLPTAIPSGVPQGKKKRGRPRKYPAPPPQPARAVFKRVNSRPLERCNDIDVWGSKRKQRNDAKFIKVPVEHEEMMEIRERMRRRPEYRAAPHKCHACILTFTFVTQLERHNATKHSEEAGAHECEVCRVRFRDRDLALRHRARHYLLHACGVCGTTHAARADLARHFAQAHSQAQDYVCNICGMTFKKERKMRYHKEKEHKPALQCSVCGKVFRSPQVYRSHVKIHLGLPTVECALCRKPCRGDYGLYAHMRAEHDPRPAQALQCDPCGVQFKNLVGLRHHLKTSVKHATPAQLRFECEKCQKRFLSKGALNQHDQYYHKQYTCHVCGKELSSRYTMYKHMRFVHEGHVLPKRHVCEVCGKAFKAKIQLTAHTYTHTGERPHACDICTAKFAQLSTLRTHQKLIHNHAASRRVLK